MHDERSDYSVWDEWHRPWRTRRLHLLLVLLLQRWSSAVAKSFNIYIYILVIWLWIEHISRTCLDFEKMKENEKNNLGSLNLEKDPILMSLMCCRLILVEFTRFYVYDMMYNFLITNRLLHHCSIRHINKQTNGS